jgi:hypothetical protein
LVPGCQSLYDVVTGDTFLFGHFSGSTFTLIAIFSRFDFVVKLSSENTIFVTLVCSLYCLAFISVCVHAGCLSILRIVCLTNLNFIEEKIGEAKTRIIITMTAIVMAILACSAQIVSGEINSGTAFAFLTRQTVTTGMN